MTTLAEMADQAQLYLSDSGAGTWPQATVEAWVLDAIRDYSQTFPMTQEITLSTGSRTTYYYTLTIAAIGVTLVEYPTGQDPPVYLKHRSRTHPDFFGNEGWYDVQYFGSAETKPVLWLSVIPTTDIGVTLLRHHDSSVASGSAITVPDHHHSLLILYVCWQAFKERLAAEEQDPDTTLAGAVTLLQQLVKGATQAEAEYRRALERAKQTRSPGAIVGTWKADEYDPIY